MFRTFASVLVISALGSGGAFAACAPVNPSSYPDQVQENGQRIVCLQAELAATTRLRDYEFELKALERSILDLEMQRRFDALPKPPVMLPVPTFPQP